MAQPKGIAHLMITCPVEGCGKEGTVRGIKHHYTSLHSEERGRLAVAVVEVPVSRREVRAKQRATAAA